MPPQTLKIHPETFLIHPQGLKIHPETFSMHPQGLKRYPETFLIDPQSLKRHPETFSVNPESLKRHPETFSEDNYPEETREYLFPPKENKITKLKLHRAAIVLYITVYGGAENFY